jgi:nucleoside phosphorylase
MLLIVAALAEELDIAAGLCSARTRTSVPGTRAWNAVCRGAVVHFLKTGVGPRKSSRSLEKILESFVPARILVIGYGGALSGELKLGDIVAIRRASLLGGNGRIPLEETRLEGTWDLAEGLRLLETARKEGIPAHLCDGLTVPVIVGDPGQKRFLRERFGPTVIDMETAALARVAATAGIPISCVRAVSDEAEDAFLAPFSYDPAVTRLGRARRVLAQRNWFHGYGEWRRRAAMARETLRRFLKAYLESPRI